MRTGDGVSGGRTPWRVAAMIGGSVVALAAAECLLRATGAGRWDPPSARLHLRRDTTRGYWELDPTNPPEHRWDGDPYGRLPAGAAMSYAISSDGLRGASPPPGARSVVLLGDSFTFGIGVPEDSTAAVRLERALAIPRAARPRDRPLAVINAGVPGYGTREQAARLPDLLARFDPEAVVLVFVPNDALPIEDTFDREDFIRDTSSPVGPLRILDAWTSAAARAERDRAVEAWYLSYYVGERRARWEEARRGLLAMDEACRARGSAFGVAVFPLLHRLDERPLAVVHELVRSACASRDIPCLDLTPTLAEAGERALWIHPTDHHPSSDAHGRVAAALTPFVERLLESRPAGARAAARGTQGNGPGDGRGGGGR